MTDKQKDIKWSKEIKERDRYHCRLALPGCMGKATDACHIFSRSYKALRWDIENGVAGCRKCHSWWENKNRPEEFKKFVIMMIGQDTYDRLAQKLKDNYGVSR